MKQAVIATSILLLAVFCAIGMADSALAAAQPELLAQENQTAKPSQQSQEKASPQMGQGGMMMHRRMMQGQMMGGYPMMRPPAYGCPCMPMGGPAMMGPHMMGPMGMIGGHGMMMFMNADPKTRGKMMQIQGQMMKEMGQLLEDRGKALEQGK